MFHVKHGDSRDLAGARYRRPPEAAAAIFGERFGIAERYAELLGRHGRRVGTDRARAKSTGCGTATS